MEVNSPHVSSALGSSFVLKNYEYVAVGFTPISLEIVWYVAHTVGEKHKQISVVILQKGRALRTTAIESGMCY